LLTGLVFQALERINFGDYGRCLNCGSSIGSQRLVALPWAELCGVCQELKAESQRLEQSTIFWRSEALERNRPRNR
jgi:RNA polymerase-binding transcription factor DksA